MKLNMDMRSFFKLIGRKSKHFFSLLFVWAFFQINIQAQTEVELVNVDFLSDEWSSGDLPTQGSVNDVYFGNDFAIVAEGLNNTGGNMTKERFAAVQFTIPEGRTVEYVTLEVKMSKEKGKMRARLLKADTIVFPADFLEDDKDNYIELQAADGDYVISKQLHNYGADDQINNGGEPIVPGNYVFYFGRGSSNQYIQSLKISYTYSNVSCTPLTISDGTSDLTSLNLEKGNSATLSAKISGGTFVSGTWSVENANPMGVVTMDGNTVRASSDIGSAELVFTPADNTYCEAVIPVYVAEGEASPPDLSANFNLSTTSWCFGEPLTVNATSTSTTGIGTLAYQWYKDDAALAGQTQSNYSLEAEGEYYCKVTYTESGYFPVMVESPHATITTLTPQIIPQVTGEGMYNIGETDTLQVTASGGDGSYSYQWYSANNENGDGAVEIAGATSAAYLASSASAQTFYFYCEINSGACTEITDVQTVTFTEGPCYELFFTVTSGTTWEDSYTVSGGTVNNSGDVKFTNDGFTFGGNNDLLTITLDYYWCDKIALVLNIIK